MSDYPGGFDVTGQLVRGGRFKRHYAADEAFFAFHVNLWRGTVWGVMADGRRRRLRRVYNV